MKSDQIRMAFEHKIAQTAKLLGLRPRPQWGTSWAGGGMAPSRTDPLCAPPIFYYVT